MSILTKEQYQEYKEQGCLIIKNFIDLEPINKFMDSVAHVISLEGKEILKGRNLSKDEILNDLIIEIKRKNPSSSSWIYQTILNSYALKEFFIDIDIAKVAMELLDMDDQNNLGTVSPAFRFDIPGDTKNIRAWHQDSNYFLENENGNEHLVAWIPLNKAYKDNGSVIIAPRTHTIGRKKSQHIKSEGFKSEQYVADEKFYSDLPKEYIEAEEGDIAFINMDLIHSSGTNITTDSVRYTAQIRFNTINRDAYRPVLLNQNTQSITGYNYRFRLPKPMILYY